MSGTLVLHLWFLGHHGDLLHFHSLLLPWHLLNVFINLLLDFLKIVFFISLFLLPSHEIISVRLVSRLLSKEKKREMQQLCRNTLRQNYFRACIS